MLQGDETALIAECEARFGFRIEHSESIHLGWLNKKWTLHTDCGRFVLKKYSDRRYSNEETLHRALKQQRRLHGSGVPCPELLERDGNVLHTSDAGEKYIVMRFCEGERMEPGAASAVQMLELGRVTAEIHALLNDGSLGTETEPQFVPPNTQERLSHWDALLERSQQEGRDQLAEAVGRHRSLTERIDLDALRIGCEHGWAHRDLWADNLLFRGNRVSAVLDFDRLHYDYPCLDIARAIMSLALDEARRLRPEAVGAFLKGYRELRPFTDKELVQSIRLLWYLESVWWIRPLKDETDAVPKRFAEEMNWIVIHEQELEERMLEYRSKEAIG